MNGQPVTIPEFVGELKNVTENCNQDVWPTGRDSNAEPLE